MDRGRNLHRLATASWCALDPAGPSVAPTWSGRVGWWAVVGWRAADLRSRSMDQRGVGLRRSHPIGGTTTSDVAVAGCRPPGWSTCISRTSERGTSGGCTLRRLRGERRLGSLADTPAAGSRAGPLGGPWVRGNRPHRDLERRDRERRDLPPASATHDREHDGELPTRLNDPPPVRAAGTAGGTCRRLDAPDHRQPVADALSRRTGRRPPGVLRGPGWALGRTGRLGTPPAVPTECGWNASSLRDFSPVRRVAGRSGTAIRAPPWRSACPGHGQL
jgi:hypothetical protein